MAIIRCERFQEEKAVSRENIFLLFYIIICVFIHSSVTVIYIIFVADLEISKFYSKITIKQHRENNCMINCGTYSNGVINTSSQHLLNMFTY